MLTILGILLAYFHSTSLAVLCLAPSASVYNEATVTSTGNLRYLSYVDHLFSVIFQLVGTSEVGQTFRLSAMAQV